MKVLELRCVHGHRFEGWFASEDDYLSQCERSLVACPVCGDTTIAKLPTAARLNVAHLRETPPVAADTQTTMQSVWMRAVRHVLANTEDVGERFPEEARRIHYGEIEHRGIRGQASREEAAALQDEGIEVSALPIPAQLKGPLQ